MKYNILFISSDNSASSGAFLSMIKLIEELRKYEICSHVILPYRKGGNGYKLLEEKNIPYKYIRSCNWIESIEDEFKVKKILKKYIEFIFNLIPIIRICLYIHVNKIQLAHINTTYSYVGAIAAHMMGIKIVWHLREFLEEDQGNKIWFKKYGYTLINRSDKIIAISESVYKKYLHYFSPDKIVMIYNGVDTTRFYKPSKQIFQSKTIHMICVGGLYKGKHQDIIIKACKMLSEHDITNYRLYFVGDGSEKNSYLNLVKQYNLEKNISFVGYVKEPENYYVNADIAFMSSRAEAFGRVTVESMLSGVLVIGSDSAATSEILKNKYGLIYSQDSVNDLYNKILYAINHINLMKSIASNARKYAFENFSSELNAKEIVQVYKELLENE